MSLLQDIAWFKKGELSAIWHKLNTPKMRYETHREAEVLIVLAAGIGFTLHYTVWAGLLYLYFIKLAVQALNSKGFFDSENPSGTFPPPKNADE